MSTIAFFPDVVMSREVFEQIPVNDISGDLGEIAKSQERRSSRALIARDGAQHWHMIAFHSMNGTVRTFASRIILARYQPEDNEPWPVAVAGSTILPCDQAA